MSCKRSNLLPIIDKHCDISMCTNILRVLECVEDDADPDEVLLVTVQVTFGVVRILHDPQSDTIAVEIFTCFE